MQQQMLRGAMQTSTGAWRQGGYHEACSTTMQSGKYVMNTLENNQLDDLCLLLPEQDRVLRAVQLTAGSGWRQLMWRFAAGC